MREALHFCGILPQTYIPSLIMRKTSDKPRLKEILRILTILKTVKAMKKTDSR